jgi:hypothetical protein
VLDRDTHLLLRRIGVDIAFLSFELLLTSYNLMGTFQSMDWEFRDHHNFLSHAYTIFFFHRCHGHGEDARKI